MKEIKSFTDFLKEEAQGTSSVVMREPVMRKEPFRRKELQEEKKEELDVPNIKGGLNKKRFHLPQIIDWDNFERAVYNHDGMIDELEVETAGLTPTQAHFNSEKVNRILEDGNFSNPIVISDDMYVVDGHHRWLAAHKRDGKVRAKKISLSVEKILEICKGADFVENKKINENLEQ